METQRLREWVAHDVEKGRGLVRVYRFYADDTRALELVECVSGEWRYWYPGLPFTTHRVLDGDFSELPTIPPEVTTKEEMMAYVLTLALMNMKGLTR